MHTNNITPPYLTNKTVESKVMLVLCDFLFHLNFLLPILSPMNNNGVILFSMFYFPLVGIKKNLMLPTGFSRVLSTIFQPFGSAVWPAIANI